MHLYRFRHPDCVTYISFKNTTTLSGFHHTIIRPDYTQLDIHIRV